MTSSSRGPWRLAVLILLTASAGSGGCEEGELCVDQEDLVIVLSDEPIDYFDLLIKHHDLQNLIVNGSPGGWNAWPEQIQCLVACMAVAEMQALGYPSDDSGDILDELREAIPPAGSGIFETEFASDSSCELVLPSDTEPARITCDATRIIEPHCSDPPPRGNGCTGISPVHGL